MPRMPWAGRASSSPRSTWSGRVPDPGPQLAVRRGRDRHRRGRAPGPGGLRGEDRSGDRVRHPARGHHQAEAAPAAAAGHPLGRRRTACSSTSCASTSWGCCGPVPAIHDRARSRGGLDGAGPDPLDRPGRGEGHPVEIEADIENGLVALLLVGLPDTALREARDRIRSAIVNSSETWPQRRITVGLSPASLPKRGSSFDLGHRGGHPRGGRRHPAPPGCTAADVPRRARARRPVPAGPGRAASRSPRPRPRWVRHGGGARRRTRRRPR